MDKKIIPFKPEHLDAFDKGELGYFNKETHGKTLAEAGPAFTGVVDGEIVGCAGVTLLWQGVGEAWAIISEAARKHPIFLHKSVKRFLDKVIIEHNLHRVQGTVNEGYEVGHNWLTSLGFKKEGLMLKFNSDGMNVWRYGRIRDV